MSRPEPAGLAGPDAVPQKPSVFSEPWQAQAFALTLALHDRGVFSWAEWAEALSAKVHRPDAAADGSDYYTHWLAALEAILVAKGVASSDRVEAVAAAWQRAAHATPHGQQIRLENDSGAVAIERLQKSPEP